MSRRSGLGQAVDVAQRPACHLSPALHSRQRHWGPTAADLGEAGQVVGPDRGRVQQSDVGGDAHDSEGRARARDGLQAALSLEAAEQRDRATGAVGGGKLGHKPGDVEQRRAAQDHVLSVQRHPAPEDLSVEAEIAMGVQRALRLAGGARGVDDERQLIRPQVNLGNQCPFESGQRLAPAVHSWGGRGCSNNEGMSHPGGRDGLAARGLPEVVLGHQHASPGVGQKSL